MGRLTTHVLDTARGCPAAGLELGLDRLTADGPRRLGTFTTNVDGRVDRPLLEGEAMEVGLYQLLVQAGRYFAASGIALPAGVFLDEIPIRFHIADAAAHYHVPLLLSPYGYSTYRGS
jgi:5-hydroxyisourate hydrolase